MEGEEVKLQDSILIVDDDPLCIFLSERLLQHNFIVKSVLNGHDAFSECEKNFYDVVLMDINLGDINMDGIRTMKMIRNQTKNKETFMVALTAFSHSKKWYLDQGFDELFIKPMSTEILEAIMNRKDDPAYKKAI